MAKNRDPEKKNDKEQPDDRIRKMVEALEAETDRGCALILVEFLTNELAKLLDFVFQGHGLNESERKKLLTGQYAPLGSFAARVAVCRGFGLISPAIRDTLNALREIRNHCAHTDQAVSLYDPEIDRWVRIVYRQITMPDGKPLEDDRAYSRKDLLIGVCAGTASKIIERKIAMLNSMDGG